MCHNQTVHQGKTSKLFTFFRDYRGLAELCGISGELIRSISHDSDPTYKVLKLWSDQAKSEATVAKLIQYLEHLDRFDVVDDIEDLVCRFFLTS